MPEFRTPPKAPRLFLQLLLHHKFFQSKVKEGPVLQYGDKHPGEVQEDGGRPPVPEAGAEHTEHNLDKHKRRPPIQLDRDNLQKQIPEILFPVSKTNAEGHRAD